MNPRPRHRKQGRYGFDLSSPEPPQSGHISLGCLPKGTKPVPPHTVQVSLLMAPVPPQCAHSTYGDEMRTVPLPLQTQQAESQDIMPKGSVRLPLQKLQVTSSNCTSIGPGPDNWFVMIGSFMLVLDNVQRFEKALFNLDVQDGATSETFDLALVLAIDTIIQVNVVSATETFQLHLSFSFPAEAGFSRCLALCTQYSRKLPPRPFPYS